MTSTSIGYYAGACNLSVGSMNAALRAQKVLQKAGLASTVIKNESGTHNGGCVYGLSVACVQLETAKRLLESSGIRLSHSDNH
ncbi:MAG: hypothetical protein IJW40_00270 [Clostridia bacterium]|nr:hypothetical protein [Clostridia bacterium]